MAMQGQVRNCIMCYGAFCETRIQIWTSQPLVRGAANDAALEVPCNMTEEYDLRITAHEFYYTGVYVTGNQYFSSSGFNTYEIYSCIL